MYITRHTFYKGVSYSKQLTEYKAKMPSARFGSLARNSKIDYFCHSKEILHALSQLQFICQFVNFLYSVHTIFLFERVPYSFRLH